MKLQVIPVEQAFKKAQDMHEPIETVEPKKETLTVIKEIAKELSK